MPRRAWHHHGVTTRQRQIRREYRALLADLVFGHLHQDVLLRLEDLVDPVGAIVVGERGNPGIDIVGGEEALFVDSVVDERGV